MGNLRLASVHCRALDRIESNSGSIDKQGITVRIHGENLWGNHSDRKADRDLEVVQIGRRTYLSEPALPDFNNAVVRRDWIVAKAHASTELV